MDRRELLKMIAVVTGGAVIGGEFLFSGCTNPDKGVSMVFTDDDIAFLNEVAETILPQTTTAGAKAAGVGRHMTVMVNDCYSKEDQEIFHKGMTQLNEACEKMHGHNFMKATPEERTALLVSLDKERKEYQQKKEWKMPNHYFQQMKQLTISGYFTSEKGRNESLRYIPVPGKFQGVIDYKKGDKLFAGLT
jgi:hypothetical protein